MGPTPCRIATWTTTWRCDGSFDVVSGSNIGTFARKQTRRRGAPVDPADKSADLTRQLPETQRAPLGRPWESLSARVNQCNQHTYSAVGRAKQLVRRSPRERQGGAWRSVGIE